MATAQDIITDALLEIGVLSGPGQTPSTAHSSFALNRLNQMVGEWNTRRPFLYTVDINRYTLTPSQETYTIGPASTSPDFTAPRPVGPGPGNGIIWANIVIPGDPDVFLPLNIMGDEEWANMRVRSVGTTVPIAIYNDGANPKSTLYLYGYPTVANELELFTRHQASEFASLASTFEAPAGYQKAMTLTLAENLAPIPAFVRLGAQWSQLQADNARKARAAIAGLNSAPNNLSNDAAGLTAGGVRSNFNWLTGNLQ